MVGLEALGMSLEDIFISVVENTEREKAQTGSRYVRKPAVKRARTRTTLENDVASELVKEADRKREEAADEPYEDD